MARLSLLGEILYVQSFGHDVASFFTCTRVSSYKRGDEIHPSPSSILISYLAPQSILDLTSSIPTMPYIQVLYASRMLFHTPIDIGKYL